MGIGPVLALATLLATLVVAGEPEWRVLPNVRARLLNNGRLHLQRYERGHRVALPNTPDLAVFDCALEEPWFVDSKGIRWQADLAGLRGTRAGQPEIRRPLFGANPARSIVEDGAGRVWFADDRGVQWYDGTQWQERDLLARSRELKVFGAYNEEWPGALALALSPDRATIYAYGSSTLGFWVISGPAPDFQYVSPARGLPYWFVQQVVPLANQEVLVFPGPVRLGPRQWATERAVPAMPSALWTALKGNDQAAYDQAKKALQEGPAGLLYQLELLTRRREVNWRLGEIRLYYRQGVLDEYRLDYATLIPSADGQVYLRVQRVWNVETGAEWKHPGHEFVLRRDPDGRLTRVAPEIEAFNPGYIDARGDCWGWQPVVRRLVRGQTWTLHGRADGQPLRGGEFAGVDRDGRVALTIFSILNTLFIYTPGGDPVPDAPVVWRQSTPPAK